ncbi:MAG: phenylalanine--tRNA ligase subunit alpha [Candidatus Magasanikbacteria bacterium]|nr:phenylalanine--tRNA ligase subunit alpha [Candidatus Magasanikbacteria bacterium]
MNDKILKIKQVALEAIREAKDREALRDVENEYFSRKAGVLTEMMKSIKDLSVEEKKKVGQLANETKQEIEKAIVEKNYELSEEDWANSLAVEKIDLTAPVLPHAERGHLHPVSIVQKELEEFFSSMGFIIADGPELESDYFNFSSLNIPADHPARDSQDTFYIKNHPDWVMRTHTSSLQVRSMQKYGVPLRVIMPGKCYRNEATDARHEHTFYQLEGLVINEAITMAHMKGVLEAVAKHLYGPETQVRLRPKFYPFVEPGVNGEVTCFLCDGAGCKVCKNTGWMEIFGAGMIHQSVLKEGGIDPEKYQGFAFGFGLTRLVMLKYGIEDARILQSGDLRFIKQF